MEKVRWGVLSTADIAATKVIPAMQQGMYCEIAAIASRTPEKARAVAAQLGIPKAYGSYEELLADPDIDAIYNPLPNPLHVPWSINALHAGKHVLCEKPIALNRCGRAIAGRCCQAVPPSEGNGSVHVSPPSTVAASPATGSRREHRRTADNPVILLILSR